MSLSILYFAWVRERIGHTTEQLPLDRELPVREVLAQLAACSPGHASALADLGKIRAAINTDMADLDAIVRPGDELALFPPVTGG